MSGENDDIALIQRILAGDELLLCVWLESTRNRFTRLPGGKLGISISLKILRRKPSCKFIRNWKPWRIRRGFQGGFMSLRIASVLLGSEETGDKPNRWKTLTSQK